MECFAIYTYLHEDQIDGIGPGYYIIQLFDERGYCDRETLEEVYVESFHSELQGPFVGPFEGVSHIRDYCFRLSTFLKGKVFLISVEDYNQVLDKSSDSSELLESIRESGQEIEDLEISSSQRLWSKFTRSFLK